MQDSIAVSAAQRVVNTLRLDHDTMREVSRDPAATSQAVGVVAITAIIAGLGVLPIEGTLGLIGTVAARVAGWALFGLVASILGVIMVPDDAFEADTYELLRPLGFAQVPTVLAAFMYAGVVGQILEFLGGIWAIVCVVAVLQAVLDVSTIRAFFIGLFSAIITFVILLIPATIIAAFIV